MLLYKDYLQGLSDKFIRKLEDIGGIYGFDYGLEFEIAICEILRSFLPSKYGVCRGYVVSENGEVAGDDIIIYDQERFPTLRLTDAKDIARKEQIPIEAVYAYIEAKHTLILGDKKSKSSLNHALEQVRKVKELCLERPKVKISQIDPHLPEIPLNLHCDVLPDFRNPIFTVIISRYVADRASKRIDDIDEIDRMLHDEDIDKSYYNPELIISGQSNYMSTGYYLDKSKADGVETAFLLNKEFPFYGVHKVADISYGLFLAYLMHSIDFIRLGGMPWVKMINEVIQPKNR